MITSIKNPKVKIARDLISAKKKRDASNLMVVEGVRLAEEAVLARLPIQLCLYTSALSTRGLAVLEQAKKSAAHTEEISPDLLARISSTKTPQGLLLVCAIPAIPLPVHADAVIVLDKIRDPGNMGTILRTSAAMGMEAVLLTPGTTDPFSPKVMRSAMGAQFHLPIRTMGTAEINQFCIHTLQPALAIISADADGTVSCWEADLTGPLCLIIGSEACGLSTELEKLTDISLRIPMKTHTESFNAAIAAGILMYEMNRQRKIK